MVFGSNAGEGFSLYTTDPEDLNLRFLISHPTFEVIWPRPKRRARPHGPSG